MVIKFQARTLTMLLIIGAMFTLALLPSSQPLAAQSPLPVATSKNLQKKYANTVIIQTHNPDTAVKSAQQEGLYVKEVFRSPDGPSLVEVATSIHDAAIGSLKTKLPADAKISPNIQYRAASHIIPNDIRYADQWNLAKIQAPAAWDTTIGSSSTVLAVIDSGMLFSQTINGTTYSQPDFPADKRWANTAEAGALATNGIDDDSNGFIDDWQGWDFMGGFSGDIGCPNYSVGQPAGTYYTQDNDPQPYSCDSPDYPTELNKTHYNGTCTVFVSACAVGHGTVVGSVAGAKTNNSALIAGVDHNVSLMNIRVLDGYGFTDTSVVTKAIRYATANGADVINLSLAASNCEQPSSDPVLEDALADAYAAGIAIVAASGNEGLQSVCYPASSGYAIAVGATNSSDQKASFSNGGSQLDVVAPGVAIPAANAISNARPSDYHPNASGTSLATPHVAGLASLLKSVNSSFTPKQVRQVIIAGANKTAGMDGASFTSSYGYGRINAQASLRLASTSHPDGTLVQASDDPKVYLLENGTRRPIPTRQIFESHSFLWESVERAFLGDMALTESTLLEFREGTLLQGSSSAVYVVDHSGGQVTKRHITSKAVFLGLGYTSSDIMRVSDTSLPVTNGPGVTSANQHPDGTLIQARGDAKVYLLENGQRRHIVSSPAFYSHSFTPGRIKIATSQDSKLPLGTILNFREGILVQGSPSPIYVINYEAGVIEKRHITSRSTFDFLGYTFSQVMRVPDSTLPTATGATL